MKTQSPTILRIHVDLTSIWREGVGSMSDRCWPEGCVGTLLWDRWTVYMTWHSLQWAELARRVSRTVWEQCPESTTLWNRNHGFRGWVDDEKCHGSGTILQILETRVRTGWKTKVSIKIRPSVSNGFSAKANKKRTICVYKLIDNLNTTGIVESKIPKKSTDLKYFATFIHVRYFVWVVTSMP